MLRSWLILLAMLAAALAFALLIGFLAENAAHGAELERPEQVASPCYEIGWLEVTPAGHRPQFYDVHVGGDLIATVPVIAGPRARICTPTPGLVVPVEIVGRFSDGSLTPYGPREFEYVGDFDRDGDRRYGFGDFGLLFGEGITIATLARFGELFGQCIRGGVVGRCGHKPRRDPRCRPDPSVVNSLRYCPE